MYVVPSALGTIFRSKYVYKQSKEPAGKRGKQAKQMKGMNVQQMDIKLHGCE